MSARRHRPPTPAELDRLVGEFNNRVGLGAAVEVLLDDGSVFKTRTRSEAQILGGHSAVIWVDGVGGCYALERVKPL